jgi:prophage DNA circulation protein
MSWLDNLKDGSFRGVPFNITDAGTLIGRRTSLTEYPLRDEPYSEDLGRRQRRFVVECVVLGDDYMTARDNLIAALEAKGPGTLVHPYYGTRSVVVADAVEIIESQREGGCARFRIPFAESGENLQPSSTADTQAQVQSQVSAVNTQLGQSFGNAFSVNGMPQWVTDATTSDLGGLMSKLASLRDSIPGIPSSITDFNAALASFSSDLTGLISSPFDLGASIVSLIVGLGSIAAQPLDALGLYTSLFDYGADAPAIAQTTPARVQQATNNAALYSLVQGAALSQAVSMVASTPAQTQTTTQLQLPSDTTSTSPSASSASGTGSSGSASASASAASASTTPVPVQVTVNGFDTTNTAITVRDQLTDQIDVLVLTADDELYPMLQDLRAAIVTDVDTRIAVLPNQINFVPAATLPALVIAYRLYGDATRDLEIVARNDLPYPGFVTGGQALEVLSE